MTAPALLTYILAALLTQFVVGIVVVAWRRRGASSRLPVPTAGPSPRAATGAWPGWRDFRVTRRSFEDAAQSQCSFHLQPVDESPLPPFRPGQFLTFSLPAAGTGSGAAAVSITRCYSLSDRPDPAGYRITVKRLLAPAGRPDLPPGLSSSHFHEHVHEGDMLRVKAPAGHFVIDASSSLPVVLIAGGIGITPLLSMIRWCVTEQPARTLHLYYGVRNSAEQAFKPMLELLSAEHPAFHLHVAFSQPGTDDEAGRDFQHAGRVDVDLLRRTLPHGRHQFYVCGPPAMMESLVPALAHWGVPQQDIHFEAFGPASVRLPGSAPSPELAAHTGPFEVKFSRSGRTLAWNGQDANLLDFAERHGLAVESGCRSGGCGTCETRLDSGEVRYDQAPDHDIAAGHCLLCVGRPTSALVLEA